MEVDEEGVLRLVVSAVDGMILVFESKPEFFEDLGDNIVATELEGGAISATFLMTVAGRSTPSSSSSLSPPQDEEDEETSAVLSVISRPSSSTHSLSKSLRLKSRDLSSIG